MNQGVKPTKLEILFLELHDYLDARIKQAKLSAIDGLSVICSAAISAIIAAFFFCLAFVFVSALASYALYLVSGSIILSISIMCLIFVALGLFFWLSRSRMFTDSMVRIFARAFFEKHK